ncbi:MULTISPECIES: hypothetical protein [Streptomyces]|uniref:Uncharacterized protein n=1 Tax=Streptomyces lienomycini TaxID=284035 RepID=A0ABV9X5C4_9ACTN|nr:MULTISPECIES: hypothetical protein [Streptomyces]
MTPPAWGFPLFLPEDTGVGRPGLEALLHAATNTRPPHEWTDHLRGAGFVLEERRPFEIRLDRTEAGPPPVLPAAASRSRTSSPG